MLQKTIDFLSTHRDVIRPIWFALGLVGMFIFYKIQPEFYRGKPQKWKFIVTFVYMILGPGIFLLSLIFVVIHFAFPIRKNINPYDK